MHPKDAVGIANSVDPDQTAPVGADSDLGLHCLPDLSVRKLGNITVSYDLNNLALYTVQPVLSKHPRDNVKVFA